MLSVPCVEMRLDSSGKESWTKDGEKLMDKVLWELKEIPHYCIMKHVC